MDLGRELVACALREQTLKPFTEAGITREWLTDQEDTTRAAVFSSSEDLNAWMTLVGHWEQHGKVPSVDMFRRSYPEDAYRLPDTEYTADELTGIFREDRREYLTQMAASDITDVVGEENWDGALELMVKAARIIRETRIAEHRPSAGTARSTTRGADGPQGQARHPDRHAGPGQPVHGFQPGNLICYLGRAKAAKTSFALLSAITAWETASGCCSCRSRSRRAGRRTSRASPTGWTASARRST